MKRAGLLDALLPAVLLTGMAVMLSTGCDQGGVTEALQPVADAGPDTAVAVRSQVRLDGSRSRNGTSYRWGFISKPAGSEATMTYNVDYSFGYFTPDSAGVYEAQLRVSRGGGSYDPSYDEVMVTAVEMGVPLADAGPDRMLDVGESGTLDGSGSSDPEEDDLTYSWSSLTQGALTIIDENSEVATFVLEHPGLYEAELTVSDGTHEHSDRWRDRSHGAR